jgi:SAM-dependent methyltransferase
MLSDGIFKRHFTVTGVDISLGMLNKARIAHSDIEYLEGDMRTLRLNRQFDAVIIPDSIDYMASRDDLQQAIQTAVTHLKTEGFFKSILFSATRLESSHIQSAPSVNVVFKQEFTWIVGLKAKLLMLFLMGMIYLSFFKENMSIFVCSAMTMMIFLYFNSVLFLQYFLWSLCLIPFALVELITLSPLTLTNKEKQRTKD